LPVKQLQELIHNFISLNGVTDAQTPQLFVVPQLIIPRGSMVMPLRFSQAPSAMMRLHQKTDLRRITVLGAQIILHEFRRITPFLLEKSGEIIFLFFCLDTPYVVV